MLVACVNQDPGIRPNGRKGAAVHVAAMREAFAACGAEVFAVDGKDDASVADALEGLLGRRRPDLIYERYALGCTVASRLAGREGIPHVLEVNAPLIDEARRHRGLQDIAPLEDLEREIFKGTARILAVSTQVAAAVRERGVPADRVWVRPNAVDTDRFRPRPSGWHPAGLELPADRFMLGFHGRLRPWHGFPRLVEATRRLLGRGLPVHLLIVGEGDWEHGLEGRLPPERRTVLGWQPHERVSEIVARFDALALAYDPQAPCYFSPLKLLEAMAVGAVPVVPMLGDLPSVVQHEVNGLLYPAGDVQALTEALERVIRDSSLRDALGRAALATARRRSWKNLAAEVLRLGAGVEAG
jgi:glycosyltransferase involved in cell wall biosynthesis